MGVGRSLRNAVERICEMRAATTWREMLEESMIFKLEPNGYLVMDTITAIETSVRDLIIRTSVDSLKPIVMHRPSLHIRSTNSFRAAHRQKKLIKLGISFW